MTSYTEKYGEGKANYHIYIYIYIYIYIKDIEKYTL